FAELLLGEELPLLQLRVARIDDHVILKIDDLLQAGGLHVEQRPQAAGHGLEEPDVDDGGGKLDVAHALAADAAMRDLDAATVADHALVFHAAVLAAGAFPILLRAENALAEQAVLFRAIGAVVDGFRLLHLPERPAADVVRAGEANADRSVVVNAIVTGFTRTHTTYSLYLRGSRTWLACRGSNSLPPRKKEDHSPGRDGVRHRFKSAYCPIQARS